MCVCINVCRVCVSVYIGCWYVCVFGSQDAHARDTVALHRGQDFSGLGRVSWVRGSTLGESHPISGTLSIFSPTSWEGHMPPCPVLGGCLYSVPLTPGRKNSQADIDHQLYVGPAVTLRCVLTP